MIHFLGALLFLSALTYQIVTFILFLMWVKTLNKPEEIKNEGPGISVLVPVKGPNTNFKKTLLSLLNQNYSGPYEVILAFQERNDPDLLIAREVFESHPQKSRLKILSDLPFLGYNPKNSNLVHAFRASQYDLVYCCDSDTHLPVNHFSIAAAQIKNRERFYGTALSVHQNLGNLGAILEGVGTNFEMVGYFMLMTKLKKSGPINGGGFFISKKLLLEIGGLESTLNFITDDLFLANKVEEIGAEGFIIKSLGRVDLPTEGLTQFFSRFRRWILIVRCFDKSMFFTAPLSWGWQWLLVLWFFSHQDFLLRISLNIMALRVIQSFIYQTFLKVPQTDAPKCLFLPFYDLLTPLLWLSSVANRNVRWGGQKFTVESNGLLKRRK